jgi:hypothetical protein
MDTFQKARQTTSSHWTGLNSTSIIGRRTTTLVSVPEGLHKADCAPLTQHTLAGPRENLPQTVVSIFGQRNSTHIVYLPEHLQISLPTTCNWNMLDLMV